MSEVEMKEPPLRKKIPPPVPKFSAPPVPKFNQNPVEHEKMSAEMESFFAEIHSQQENQKPITEEILIQATPQLNIQQSEPIITQVKQQDLTNLNDKLSNILKVCKTSTKLTPIVNKPQEYDPSKPNNYQDLKKQFTTQPETQIIEEEIDYDTPAELGAGEEKALKMMEKFGYKFGLGLGKFNQGIQNPIEVIKTSNTVGVIEVSQMDFTDLLPQNVVYRKTFEQHKQQPTKILVLLNMVTFKDVDQYLENEIKQEMSKFGLIRKIHIETKSELDEDLQVRVFLEYDTEEEAMQAFLATDQRVFGDRLISCRFYNIQKFNDGLFDQELE